MLWKSEDAEAVTGGRSTAEWSASGVSIDSRTLKPGDLFAALQDQRDGHEFVGDAFRRGAAAALVERIPEGVPAAAPMLVVESCLAALESLGRAGRDRCHAKVIAVTGSSGKTSSKEMLRVALDTQGKVHAAEQSFNNHWGVPLTLARMPQDTDFAVIEIGMNNPGEIRPLSGMTRPHAALVTMVSTAHLAAFASVEEIAREKATIFCGLERGGTAIINPERDPSGILDRTARSCGATVLKFGSAETADFKLLEARVASSGTIAKAIIDGHFQTIKLAAMGRHFVENALGVLGAVSSVGADPVIAALRLCDWLPPKGRGSRQKIVLDEFDEDSAIDLIDDAFNANPASLEAALEVLRASEPQSRGAGQGNGRRIAILGDMLELGPDEAKIHAGIAKLPAMEAVGTVHCAGPLMRHLHDALPVRKRGCWRSSAEELVDKAHRLASPGDVILVKGSKGSRISIIASALRKLGTEPEN